MKKIVILCALIITLVACGGGGGSDTCSFDFSTITNGATGPTATSYWNCVNSNGTRWYFSIFDNGSGVEHVSGYDIAVTWEETACRDARVVDASGSTHVTEITGSISSQVLTFTLTQDETGSVDTNSCFLVTL